MHFPDVDECQYNKGGCEYKCINLRGGYRCDCPKDQRLHSDGRSCIGTLEALIIGNINDIMASFIATVMPFQIKIWNNFLNYITNIKFGFWLEPHQGDGLRKIRNTPTNPFIK